MFMKYFKEKKSFDINLKNSEKYKFGGVGATVDQNTYRATDTTREKKKSGYFQDLYILNFPFQGINDCHYLCKYSCF